MGVMLGDKVKLTFIGRCYSQRILFVRWYRCTQAAAPGDTVKLNMTQLITAVNTAGVNDIVTPYTDILQDDYQMIQIQAQVVKPVRLAYTSLDVLKPGTGGAGTVANDSACLTLRTLSSGRDQVANHHIGPIPDGVSLSGKLTVGYIADVALLGGVLVTPMQPVALGPIYAPIIYHRATDSWDQATDFVVGEQSRVQRRRTVGIGE